MTDTIQVEGIVLSSMPIGERDKRVELLTRELGRISAFARGARRPGSALMAVANPFVFGQFRLICGRDAYVLTEASVRNYFTELAAAQPEVYFGFYFLEFAGYYSREGIDATETLNLLYLSLLALQSDQIDDRLVRRIFEIRLMTINGDFACRKEDALGETARYAVQYAASAPLKKLYTFRLSDEALEEVERYTDRQLARVTDRPLKSLDILKKMYNI